MNIDCKHFSVPFSERVLKKPRFLTKLARDGLEQMNTKQKLEQHFVIDKTQV